MQYLRLSEGQRGELLASLAGMPAYLDAVFGNLDPAVARQRETGGGFSPIEQVWHLADLEAEGFGARIRRLQCETRPHLPDFDGDAIARARDYCSRSINKGLIAFARARQVNLAALRALRSAAWARAGTQEGVGEISLCDLPGFMQQHDAAHRGEIEDWRQHHAP